MKVLVVAIEIQFIMFKMNFRKIIWIVHVYDAVLCQEVRLRLIDWFLFFWFLFFCRLHTDVSTSCLCLYPSCLRVWIVNQLLCISVCVLPSCFLILSAFPVVAPHACLLLFPVDFWFVKSLCIFLYLFFFLDSPLQAFLSSALCWQHFGFWTWTKALFYESLSLVFQPWLCCSWYYITWLPPLLLSYLLWQLETSIYPSIVCNCLSSSGSQGGWSWFQLTLGTMTKWHINVFWSDSPKSRMSLVSLLQIHDCQKMIHMMMGNIDVGGLSRW